MLLKRLYEEYDIDIDKIILRDYKKLGLKYIEATMLLVLLSSYKKRKVFSIGSIAKKTDLKKEKVEEITYSLIEKGFMVLELENSNEKEREIFNLDPMFTILDKFIMDSESDEYSSACGKTISQLEMVFNRALTDVELNYLRSVYEEQKYTHDEITKAIEIAEEKNKLSIKAIDKILLSIKNADERIEIDEKTMRTLDEIYKSIK